MRREAKRPPQHKPSRAEMRIGGRVALAALLVLALLTVLLVTMA
jgi:hypothetical protein